MLLVLALLLHSFATTQDPLMELPHEVPFLFRSSIILRCAPRRSKLFATNLLQHGSRRNSSELSVSLQHERAARRWLLRTWEGVEQLTILSVF